MSEHRMNWIRGVRKGICAVPAGLVSDVAVQIGDYPRVAYPKLCDLVELAQLAVLPGDAEPTADGVTYGEWTTLGHLEDGTLFETRNGSRWLISDCDVTEIGSRQRLTTWDEMMEVRQIHLPAPVAPPQEPEPITLDVTATLASLDKASAVMAEVRAQVEAMREAIATQGTAGG